MRSRGFSCPQALGYPCIREIWPERVTVLIIILVIFLTSHGVGACVVLAFASGFYRPAWRAMFGPRSIGSTVQDSRYGTS